jgi:hypothetical protein
MTKTNSADVSIVIQGPMAPLSGEVVSSARRSFPKSEIIVSTWQGSDTSSLDADIVLKSEDPGALIYGKCRTVDNVNRQIISTLTGLRAVSRPFAVKLRTDCKLTHSGLLNLFERYPDRNEADRVFTSRIICSEVFCRDPRRAPFLFHPSDVFQFGRTQDLLTAWNVPLRPQPEIDHGNPWASFQIRPYMKSSAPLVPEQYLWTHVLEKAGFSFPIECANDWNASWLRRSEELFANNFVSYSAEELGIELPRHFFEPSKFPLDVYSHARWLELYRRYCHPDRTPTIDLNLLFSSCYVFFGFSDQPFRQRLRVLAGAFRRQLQHAIGLRQADC